MAYHPNLGVVANFNKIKIRITRKSNTHIVTVGNPYKCDSNGEIFACNDDVTLHLTEQVYNLVKVHPDCGGGYLIFEQFGDCMHYISTDMYNQLIDPNNKLPCIGTIL